MPLEDIPFEGLAALDVDERIPFAGAYACDDCYTDDDAISGRNGYRNAIAASAAVGSGTPQLIARYRPSPTSARTVVVTDGKILLVEDPASETATTAAPSVPTATFGSTANVSAAQLHGHLYIASDEATVPMYRMGSGYTPTSLEAMQQPTKPTVAAFSAIAFTKFMDLTVPSGDDLSLCTIHSDTYGLARDASNTVVWRSLMDSGGGHNTPTAAYVKYNLGSDFDASAYEWLVIAITPSDAGGNGPNERVDILLGTGTGSVGSMANAQLIGETYDVPGSEGGSPSLVFISLSELSSTVRSAIRYIQFLRNGEDEGSFAVYGYAFLPSKPMQNPQKYYVTYFNNVTGQESPVSEELEVTIRDQDKLSQGVKPGLLYPPCWMHRDNFKNLGKGGTADILFPATGRNFNFGAGKVWPKIADIGAVVTINGTTPAAAGPSHIRLWKDTSNGRRLVKEIAYTGTSNGAQNYSITDTGGPATLANTKYKPGGTPPPCIAMASRAGRLICGGDPAYPNRLSISSFVAPDKTSSPYPQFPPIAMEEADGWAYDVSSETSERILALENGDALYIGTNERVLSMHDLTPNTPYYEVLKRGVLGRSAMTYAEGQLFWASTDGVYAASGRAGWAELSEPIRRLYTDWLAPGVNTVVKYQSRKLLVFGGGLRFLRYDFVKRRWSRGTLAHTVSRAATWRDPAGVVEHLWMLTDGRKVQRWQASATSDDGTAIPDWVYSTGFDRTPVTVQGRKVYLDSTGDVEMSLHTTTNEADAYRVWRKPRGEHAHIVGAGLTGYKMRCQFKGSNATKLRAAMWERQATPKGGVGD